MYNFIYHEVIKVIGSIWIMIKIKRNVINTCYKVIIYSINFQFKKKKADIIGNYSR